MLFEDIMLQRLHTCLMLLSIVGVLSQKKPIALIGTILSTDGSINNGTLLIVDGRIASVGTGISLPNNAIVLHTNGVILPGLIDLHNHLTWNIFPRWKPTEEFSNRYDWQENPIYKTLLASPHQKLTEAGLSCEMQRYAEVKAITQGTTSVMGSLRRSCNQGLARNLDDDPRLGQILYEVFPLQMSETKLQEVKNTLSANGSLFVHLAEGSLTDALSTQEFSMLKARDLLVPGVSIIHGVALTETDFLAMANASIGLVWSPRSNFELYGSTANLQAAFRNGVLTAIAPDWSPTGSDGLLSELNFAARWNAALKQPIFDDRQLLQMATINPAKLVHLDKRLGALREGYLADVVVLQSKHDPFWTATHATPEEVLLVIIDGKAVYGDPKIMERLVHPTRLESLDICGIKKSISFASQSGSQPSFHQTQKLLNAALRQWSRSLASLSECEH